MKRVICWKNSSIPPNDGKIEGTFKLDASQSILGCPSNIFVQVMTALESLISSNTSLLLN